MSDGLARRGCIRLHLAMQVDHPNCIKLFDVYITPRKVYLVTELVSGGELLDRCGGIATSVGGWAAGAEVTRSCRPVAQACS